MMKLLKATQFGNPILRSQSRRLTVDEVSSVEIQDLIADMYFTLEHKDYGVGLAAPQIGVSLAIAVIGIKPTPTRPDLVPRKLTLINPEITAHSSSKKPMWEACISFGSGKNYPYAQAMRYSNVTLRWLDEFGHSHQADFDGFIAQVIQHEVDHLNGVLFVDRVKDTRTYVTQSEYKKIRKQK